MAIAIAVLLLIMASVTFVLLFLADDGPSFLMCLLLTGVNVAAGVLNITTDVGGLQIATGVWLLVWAVLGLAATCVMIFAEEEYGLGFLALLATAWVLTFGILQLTIVV